MARKLVWVSFAGQAAFVAAWIAAGALEPRYSHLEEGVSALAARDSAYPWIVTAGLIALGIAIAALAGGLALALPRRRLLPVVLFGLAAATILAAAAFRLDCSPAAEQCRRLWDAGALSWHQDAHLWASIANSLVVLLTPFALARALWPGTAAAVALSAGGAGVVIAILSSVAYAAPGAAGGLVQRADLFVLHVWLLIVGGGILHATRGAPRLSELIPMRPRDFLAHSWSGEGRLVLRPFFVGRLFAQRCDARRESTWLSERVWRIDDEAHFGRGRFERRQMYCEFVADDHVRLTGDDLLDGADVWLEEGGWRLAEFRIAWAVGPLPVIVRVADHSRVEPDGTFVNQLDVYTLGPRIPVARVTFRMRPSALTDPSEGTQRALELM